MKKGVEFKDNKGGSGHMERTIGKKERKEEKQNNEGNSKINTKNRMYKCIIQSRGRI